IFPEWIWSVNVLANGSGNGLVHIKDDENPSVSVLVIAAVVVPVRRDTHAQPRRSVEPAAIIAAKTRLPDLVADAFADTGRKRVWVDRRLGDNEIDHPGHAISDIVRAAIRRVINRILARSPAPSL